jgi:serine protease Do
MLHDKSLKHGRFRRHGAAVAATALIAVLAIGTALVPNAPLDAAPTAAPEKSELPRATGTVTGMLPVDFTDVIERVGPAVVNIQVNEKARTAGGAENLPATPKGMEEFFKRFFGDNFQGFQVQPRQEQEQPPAKGLGSGFVIDPDGYIVTNNHVAGEASRISVTLQDGRSYPGKLIGKDPETDLALVKIDAGRPLPFVRFSTAPTPRPGQWVIAVGNPFGLDHTATAGIVSATGRAIGSGPYDDFIQIDAPINKGNSGGPTFNLKGEVVGVNTAIYSPTGGSVGIGFAVPASIARVVVDQLREHGTVERGWLGVEIQGVNPDIAESLGIDRPRGALVTNVMRAGPAARAGLKQGDLVLAVNGEKIAKVGDLSRNIAVLRPGSEAELTLMRGGAEKNITVTLGKRPTAEKLASARGSEGGGVDGGNAALGMRLATVNDQVRQAYGIGESVGGAVIIDLQSDSPAAEKGLKPGDVIVSVAGAPVRTANDAASRIEQARKSGKRSVLMLVASGGGQRFVALPLG